MDDLSGEDPPEADEPQRSFVQRARTGQERLTSRAKEMRGRVESARSRTPVLDAALRAVEHDNLTGGPVLAGAVAFRIFLVLIPYVFVILLVLGFQVSDETSSQDLASTVGIAGLVADAVDSVDLHGFGRVTALVVVSGALLIAIRTTLKVLRVSHALVWGQRPPRAPSPKAVLAMLGLLLTFTAGGFLIRQLETVSLYLALVAMALSMFVPMGIWLVASMYFPHGDAPWWALLPGAVVFGLGVQVLHLVTVYWIAREVESKSDLYGAIGVALALLLWAYILGRIIVFGAVTNATLWRRRQLLTSEPPA